MKIFIAICGLFFSSAALSQQNDRTIFFKEVGWTITLPEDFNRLDSAQIEASNRRGKKILDSANDIRADISATKTLFAAITSTRNYVNSTITPFKSKRPGDYEESLRYTSGLVFKTFAGMPGAEADSATSVRTIDGVEFTKYEVSVSRSGKLVFSSVLLARLYKGYDFSISYIYQDTETKSELETMLDNSKFTR